MLLDFIASLKSKDGPISFTLDRSRIVRLSYHKGLVRHLTLPAGRFELDRDAETPGIDTTYPIKVTAFGPVLESFACDLQGELAPALEECWSRIRAGKKYGKMPEPEFCDKFRYKMLHWIGQDIASIVPLHPDYPEASRLAVMFCVDMFVLAKAQPVAM